MTHNCCCISQSRGFTLVLLREDTIMTQIDFKAINEQIELLEQKRSKFKAIGIACGVGAIFPIWTVFFGPVAFFAWLAALICGFVFRSVAVKARDEAMRLRLSIANLDPNALPAPVKQKPKADISTKDLPQTGNLAKMPAAPKPAASKPAAPKAKPQTTSSRLDKARRREE